MNQISSLYQAVYAMFMVILAAALALLGRPEYAQVLLLMALVTVYVVNV